MMLPGRRLLLLGLLVSVLTAGQAVAGIFSYSDFSSMAGLTTNGDAAQAGNVLRLVPSSDTQSGTAYQTIAVPLNGTTAFSTSFEFLVTSDPNSSLGATDGFTFLLQNDIAGANALGAGGEGLGYVGISPSVAVVFRGRAPSFIGVITGGVDAADLPVPFQPSGYTAFTEGAFYDKDEFAWIDYDPSSMVLSVYLSSTSLKPGSPVMSTMVDVFGNLGSQAYVGFGAGNGGAFGSQDILNWSFTSTSVPEPATLSLLALGGLAMLRRRRK
jgi:hypothetical protein